MSVFDWSVTAADNDDADSNINWAEGQAPSTVNDSARAEMARIAHWRNMLSANVTMGGTGNAYTYTTGESLAAYSDGIRLLWSPNADPTGAVTINVDTIGAKKVYMPDGTQAGNGSLDADSLYDIAYDSSLDSSAGAFKIVGFPDTTLTAADYLTTANNLSDVASASTARSNLGAYGSGDNASFGTLTASGDVAIDTDTLFADVSTDRVGIGTTSPLYDLDVNGQVLARVAVGATTTGTITSTWLNRSIFATGAITLAASIGTTGDMIGPILGNGGARTINRGTMTNMFVNGTNVSSCTLTARGAATVIFSSGATCYVVGDVY